MSRAVQRPPTVAPNSCSALVTWSVAELGLRLGASWVGSTPYTNESALLASLAYAGDVERACQMLRRIHAPLMSVLGDVIASSSERVVVDALLGRRTSTDSTLATSVLRRVATRLASEDPCGRAYTPSRAHIFELPGSPYALDAYLDWLVLRHAGWDVELHEDVATFESAERTDVVVLTVKCRADLVALADARRRCPQKLIAHGSRRGCLLNERARTVADSVILSPRELFFRPRASPLSVDHTH